MKNLIRAWLGINEDVINISEDMNLLNERTQTQGLQIFNLFHGLPFSAGILYFSAKDAARLTQPNGVQANSLEAILTGILLEARQGASNLQIEGELPTDVRDILTQREFLVEDHEGTDGKSTHIIWA